MFRIKSITHIDFRKISSFSDLKYKEFVLLKIVPFLDSNNKFTNCNVILRYDSQPITSIVINCYKRRSIFERSGRVKPNRKKRRMKGNTCSQMHDRSAAIYFCDTSSYSQLRSGCTECIDCHRCSRNKPSIIRCWTEFDARVRSLDIFLCRPPTFSRLHHRQIFDKLLSAA